MPQAPLLQVYSSRAERKSISQLRTTSPAADTHLPPRGGAPQHIQDQKHHLSHKTGTSFSQYFGHPGSKPPLHSLPHSISHQGLLCLLSKMPPPPHFLPSPTAPNLQTIVTKPMNSYHPDHLGSLLSVIPLSSAHLPPPSHSLPKLGWLPTPSRVGLTIR